MNVEFHYYITYLIAKKSGFGNDDAGIIAYSSQYVDNNDIIFEINKGSGDYFSNYISQTMNILKPKSKLFRIYPIFHFIPGNPLSESALRRDGKLHWLNTTPNSENANKIFDKAIAADNPYRIGIALHSFADTWAHQNFIGYYDGFNSMSGLLETALPDIGHADAKHNPDEPGLVWWDRRLLGDNAKISNIERFCDAAGEIFMKLNKHLFPDVADTERENKKNELIDDIKTAVRERDQENKLVDERIERYRALSRSNDYGDADLPLYDPELWFDEVVNEDVRGLRDRSDFTLTRWDPFTDKYTWKDVNTYTDSHWYKFQEQVIIHQNESWDILKETTFTKLQLDEKTL